MLRPLDVGFLGEVRTGSDSGVSRPRLRTRVRVLYQKSARRESEWEAPQWEDFEADAFDPAPPKPGTIILAGFEPDSARVRSFHLPILHKFANMAIARMPLTPTGTAMGFHVEGHEDETGDPAKFVDLGLDRAKAVNAIFHPLLQKLIDDLDPIKRRAATVFVTSPGTKRSDPFECHRAWSLAEPASRTSHPIIKSCRASSP
jgi:hypothetical protein